MAANYPPPREHGEHRSVDQRGLVHDVFVPIDERRAPRENLARRTQDADTNFSETELQKPVELIKPSPPRHYGYGELAFVVAQAVAILFFGFFTRFSDEIQPSTSVSEADAKDVVQNLYPFFQDVHVMIFIGFGFLMTFIKTSMWSALAFNWIISVWALQWGILSNGFWHQVIGGTTWHKIPLTIENLIIGDFGAGAAMITFGAILGKCNLQQLFFLVFWEMFLWGLNESIGVQKYKATDMGGSMFVHAFGAYYGVAATWFFQPKRTAESKNLQDGYISEVTALLGSIFLWMYWPSFNGALAVGAPQHRVVVNTVLSIGGSCVGAACVARWLFGKLEMEIMVNATLAGGVAIGSASDIITDPWATMTVGLCAGAFSAFSFQRIGPFLSRTINLQDTCGVNSLHGMPGILGAIVSIIAIAMSNSQGFPSDYFPKVAAGGSLGDQCAAQAYALLTTLGIAVAGGLSGGFIASLQPWHPVHALFRDDDHFWEVVNRYPPDFLIGSDETYDEAKASFDEIRGALALKANYMGGGLDRGIDLLVDEIWNDVCEPGQQNMSREQCRVFLQTYVQEANPNLVISDAAFDQIFQIIDISDDRRVQRQELADFIKRTSAETRHGREQAYTSDLLYPVVSVSTMPPPAMPYSPQVPHYNSPEASPANYNQRYH